jgi:hypothetical protein
VRRILVLVVLLGLAVPAHGQVAEPPDDDTLVFAFTGDILAHLNVNAAARRYGTPYDFRPMFEPVRHLIEGADFAICHLEVPLSPDNTNISSYPRFNGPRELAEGIAYAGFDACSTASNHTIDRGVEGALATRRILEEAGVAQSGIRKSVLEVWTDPVYDVRGVKVAHISATYWYNGLRPPRGMEWISSVIDADDIITRARRAKLFGADLVVVSMHCCVEYRHMPTAAQLETSHRLIESPDVDLVVTHHSHVVGPVERVGDKWILHGLGNFLSGQLFRPETADGVIAMVTARRSDSVWRFDKVEVIPTVVLRGSQLIVPAEEGSGSWNRTLDVINAVDADIAPFPGHVRRGARLDLAD